MEYSSKSNDRRFVCSVPLFRSSYSLFSRPIVLCNVRSSVCPSFFRSFVRSCVRRALSLSLFLRSSRAAAQRRFHRKWERPQRHLMDAKTVLFSPDVIAGARACPSVHACCDWKPNKLLAWRIDQARRRRRRRRSRWGGVGLELYRSFIAESAAAALM